MKRLLASLCLAGGLLGLNACIVAPVVPPLGFIYSDLHAPLDVNYDKTAINGKKGEAESMSILGLVAMGDASAAAAATNGGLKTINSADYEYHNILGIIQNYKTVVYGE